MARSSRTQLYLIVEGQDNTGASLTAAAAKIDQLEKKARDADVSLGRMGTAMGATGMNTDRFSVSLARLASQSTGLSGAFQVLGTEGAGLITGTAALTVGLVGLGVAAGKTAWDLGAAALKADAVAARGKDAKTSVDNLVTAFGGFKLALGKTFAPTVDEIATNMTATVALATGQMKLALEAERDSLIKAKNAASELQPTLATQEGYARDLAAIEQRLRDVISMLDGLENVAASSRALPDALERTRDRAKEAAGAMMSLYLATATVQGMNMTTLTGQPGVGAPGGAIPGLGTPKRDFQIDPAAYWKSWQQVFTLQNVDQLLKPLATGAASAGTNAARSWETAYSGAASRIGTALSSAISAANGLLPGGQGDPNAPGANGPFERVYRAMDVLKLGSASPWAGEFAGMSQEQLAKAVGDFQKGIMSEAAKSLIDMPMLVDQVRMQEMAEASRTAFANALAAAAGANPETTTAIVSSFFGGKDSKPTEAAVTALADATVVAMAGKEDDLSKAGDAWLMAILSGAQGAQEKTVTGMTQIFDAIIAEVLRRMGQPVKSGQNSKGQ